MALFAGTFENKVDGKGRVSVPAPFRAELEGNHNDTVYLYPSLEFPGAIEACTVEWMQQMTANLKRLPKGSKKRKALTATFFARARRVRLEDGGRFVLPREFGEMAGIQDRAAFVGWAEVFLVWNPDDATRAMDEFAQMAIDEELEVDTFAGLDGAGPDGEA